MPLSDTCIRWFTSSFRVKVKVLMRSTESYSALFPPHLFLLPSSLVQCHCVDLVNAP